MMCCRVAMLLGLADMETPVLAEAASHGMHLSQVHFFYLIPRKGDKP